MKCKKGFTMIELLAVIVILGIIMSIAGTAVLKQKRKANIESAKKIEQSIEDLGVGIYTYEQSQAKSDFMNMYKNGEYFKISISELSNAGYLKDISNGKIQNPSGGDGCDGYLVINPLSDEEIFKGFVDCPNLYATGQENENEYNNTNYNNTISGITNFLGNLNKSSN